MLRSQYLKSWNNLQPLWAKFNVGPHRWLDFKALTLMQNPNVLKPSTSTIVTNNNNVSTSSWKSKNLEVTNSVKCDAMLHY